MHSDTSAQQPARRKHSKAFKAQILLACGEPGASLSGIAVAHGLNPNMVQRWRREARRGELTLPETSAFIPVVTVPTHLVAPQQSPQAVQSAIEVRLQRGVLQAQVSWPAHAADDCAVWLRELFR